MLQAVCVAQDCGSALPDLVLRYGGHTAQQTELVVCSNKSSLPGFRGKFVCVSVQHFLPRWKCEQLIRQGVLEHILS